MHFKHKHSAGADNVASIDVRVVLRLVCRAVCRVSCVVCGCWTRTDRYSPASDARGVSVLILTPAALPSATRCAPSQATCVVLLAARYPRNDMPRYQRTAFACLTFTLDTDFIVDLQTLTSKLRYF
ncbi:unnamed protein product [Danaus chrysippus]|uniref:(African queen) hypothetical protein n=1 Tax=Danaus chrysippus TaxID=151541 RepID=A0A8J2WBL9_9NEOP|nr:unnamed protein product [Danaus chrysippus]